MNALLLTTAVGAVLVAGIFFAFSTFVMGALGRLRPAEGIRAMQAINVVVINAWAMGAMFGTGLLAIAVVVVVLATDAAPVHATAAIVGAALYVVGCLGVTVTRNVPLNDRLAAADAEDAAAHELWRHYLVRWTQWNHVRTAAALAGGVALFWSIGGV